MRQLADVIPEVLRDLVALNRSCALVGGLAVSARTEPRFTRDLDLAVLVTDDRDAEAVVAGMLVRGYRTLALVEQTAATRLATVRLLPRGQSPFGIVVDLLFASSGIEAEICARAEPLEILPGILVPVAVLPDLLALKILARDDVNRPQDLVDIRAMLKAATPFDLEETKQALQLIQARGFHRDRELEDQFDKILHSR